MENKKFQSRAIFRSLAFLLFFFSVLVNSQAQNLKKYYETLYQEDGTLYYIHPKEIFQNKLNNGDFTFDITYKSNEAFATFNFSYFDESEFQLDSVIFSNKENNRAYRAEKIFIDLKKSKWHYRYSISLPFAFIEQFFKESGPWIVLKTQKGKDLKLTAPKNKWKDQSEIINKIVAVIRANSL